MSGGDAFQAFLSKNDGGEDEEDEWLINRKTMLY
jgi:hypothetical protein